MRTSTETGFVPPHPQEGVLVQCFQQLDLHGQGKFADLVKKDRTAVGRFQQACLALGIGAAEGPAFVAEKLTLHELLGDGTAVDGNERPALPGRKTMDDGRQHALAHSRFSLQEDGAVRLADLDSPVDHATYGRAADDHAHFLGHLTEDVAPVRHGFRLFSAPAAIFQLLAHIVEALQIHERDHDEAGLFMVIQRGDRPQQQGPPLAAGDALGRQSPLETVRDLHGQFGKILFQLANVAPLQAVTLHAAQATAGSIDPQDAPFRICYQHGLRQGLQQSFQLAVQLPIRSQLAHHSIQR